MKRSSLHDKHLMIILLVLSIVAIGLMIGIAVVLLNRNIDTDCLSREEVDDIVDCINSVGMEDEAAADALYEEGMQKALEQKDYETYVGLMSETALNKVVEEDCNRALEYYNNNKTEDVNAWPIEARIEFYSDGLDAAIECENEDMIERYQAKFDEIIEGEEYIVYYE